MGRHGACFGMTWKWEAFSAVGYAIPLDRSDRLVDAVDRPRHRRAEPRRPAVRPRAGQGQGQRHQDPLRDVRFDSRTSSNHPERRLPNVITSPMTMIATALAM